ncbi:unnamed protein product, partial [marine sediment metagenome]
IALAADVALTAGDRMRAKVTFQAMITLITLVVGILFIEHYGAVGASYVMIMIGFNKMMFFIGASANKDAFLPSLFGLYKTNRKKFLQVCTSIQKLFIPLGIFIASALYVCSDSLIIILQGEEYRPAIGVLRVLCWSVALSYIALAADVALTAGDRMRAKVTFQAMITLITLVVGILFIEHYGAVGASYVMIMIGFNKMMFFIPYAYKKKLVFFSGLTSLFIPISFTLLIA